MDALDPQLQTAEDVREWFDALLDAGFNFHPEDSFLDVVDRDTGAASLPATTARRLDAAMGRAYELVEDPCEIGCEAFAAWEARAGYCAPGCEACRDEDPGA